MFFLLLMFLFNVLLIAEEIVEVAVVFIFFSYKLFFAATFIIKWRI